MDVYVCVCDQIPAVNIKHIESISPHILIVKIVIFVSGNNIY